MTRPRAVTVIAWLALAQGVAGILFALIWLQIASTFAPQGGLLSSLLAMLAKASGWGLMALALMYVVFAAGAWQTRGWAWWIGLLVSTPTILLFVSAVLTGGSAVAALFGLIVPVIMLWYLLSPAGRQAFPR